MGMEVNTKTPLDRESLNVVPLITWLQGQDQNLHVVTENGETPIFVRDREGHIVIKSRTVRGRKSRPLSKAEKAALADGADEDTVRGTQPSRTDDPAAAQSQDHVSEKPKSSGQGELDLDDKPKPKANETKQSSAKK